MFMRHNVFRNTCNLITLYIGIHFFSSTNTAPYFTDPEVEGKTYNIGENVAENGLVAQLSAEDEDTIGVLVYSIDNQDPSSPTNLVVFDEETPGRLIRGSTTFDREAVSPLPDNIMLLVT